jgi:BioD-like phosphotransacetylase family protein
MLEQDPQRKYSDLTLDELEQVVIDLENMSISALKEKKKDLRKLILKSAQAAKKEIERRLKI